MPHTSKQLGFTLIELIIVIVILGILATTAAPRFVDLGGDAKAASLKGVSGAINSAFSLRRAEYLVKGKTDRFFRSSDGVQHHYGWVYSGDWEGLGVSHDTDGTPEIFEATELSTNDWLALHYRQGTNDDLYIGYPVDGVSSSVSHTVGSSVDISPITSTNCYIRVRTFRGDNNLLDVAKPEVTLVTSGC